MSVLLPLFIGGIVLVVTLGSFAFVGFFVWRLVSGGMQNRAVLAHGESAQAVILNAWQTGVVMNEINPQIAMTLEVRPANRPTFQAEAKMFISMMQIPQFQPGAVVMVKYDPKDPTKVAVDTTGSAMASPVQANATPPASSPERVQALQAMLEQLKNQDNDLGARGIPAPAMILTASDMGVKVNGDNPLMTMQLQVQPTDRAPYQALAQGVVGVSAIARYQPGATIWVKYDPNDPSKVMLDHSY
jgi:hypothetical protein